MQFSATDVKKVFNRRVIFQDVSFSVKSGQTLLITGRNGSGKSTLVKILSDVLSPTEGNVKLFSEENKELASRTKFLGLVSPYLQMYDEFSAEENLQYALAIRGGDPDTNHIHDLLKRVFLFNRKNDPVRTFSSGMKQRMKYAFALAHQPDVLILDEPTANLDTEGIAMVKDIMHAHREKGILVVATNDLSDVDQFQYQVNLNAAN
jgi:heme exporter protein A